MEEIECVNEVDEVENIVELLIPIEHERIMYLTELLQMSTNTSRSIIQEVLPRQGPREDNEPDAIRRNMIWT